MSIRIGSVDSSEGTCSTWPPAALVVISLQGNSRKTVLGGRFIPIVSFSHGILCHLLLRNNNRYLKYRYLRGKKMWLGGGGGGRVRLATLFTWVVFSLEGQRYHGQGLGSAPLPLIEGEGGCGHWRGEFATAARLRLLQPSSTVRSPAPGTH